MGSDEAQWGRPRRTLVSRKGMSREPLRAEHRWTVAMAHGRAMKVVLRMVALMKTPLTLMTWRHTLHHPVPEGVGWCHPLLLLPSIAEPYSDYFFFQLQTISQTRDFLRRWLRLLVEVLLQRTFHRNLDGSPLFPLSTLGCDLINIGWRARRRVSLFEPLLQKRLQLAHIFEA